MQLLLDVQLSSKKLAPALRTRRHDVLAAAEDRVLATMADADLLAFAARESHIMVTSNVKHFLPLLREWGTARRPHSGSIMISKNVRHAHFGAVIASLIAALDAIPDQADWQDHTYWLSRSGQ